MHAVRQGMTKASEAGNGELHLDDLPDLLAASPGWDALRAAVGRQQSGTIDGAWGSAAALAASSLSRGCSGVFLILVPSLADMDPWSDDLTSFLGTPPVQFPGHETWPVVTNKGRLAPETAARLRVLQDMQKPHAPGQPPRVIIAPMVAVLQSVPARAELAEKGRTIAIGEVIDVEELAGWLIERGYKRLEAVEYPGEFAWRGGILDIFPPDRADPVRIELFGDEVESLRVFSTETQRSQDRITAITLVDVPIEPQEGTTSEKKGPKASAADSVASIVEYLPEGSLIALIEPDDLREQGRLFFERVANPRGLFTVKGAFQELYRFPTVTITVMPRASVETSFHMHVESVERFSGNVQRVREELDAIAESDRVIIACQTEAEVHRLTEVLKAGQLSQAHRLALVTGYVRAGFRLVDHGVLVLGSHELFHKEALAPTAKGTGAAVSSRKLESRAIDSFLDLKEGDYVVHIAHGISRFVGMRMLEKGQHDPQAQGIESNGEVAYEENLILEFRDGVMLYVPATRIDLVQRYIGGNTVEPELSKLGGTAWSRRKDKVAEAVRDMAAEMIQIQAVRAALPAASFLPDTDWQTEFEAAFPFQETPDQMAAITEAKHDLEKPKPMDRLICGDVGYGKTEVAIRAAFKCVDNGRQVAILVPTTVLAEQHFRTFRARLAEYPFVVEVVSRFKTAAQQKEILQRVAAGEVDIIIGTHRIVSNDVKFHDLGLVIIDEEQRFGVEHKEKLKRLRTTVHVLTMTATPIPRTLHSALLGIREISNLETPPPERQPVETRIIRWDDSLIRHAIHREFTRGGQVYFVHNRVHDIHHVAARIQDLIPEARIVVGHGQMHERELEKTMLAFVRKEADILVATTIIESGLDIPNANTIFIDDADMYGLADLHQLRGRVGRQKLRAYAYLIVDPIKLITANAQKRLKAIEEFTELGSGFKISMRDLEIRGAGNILGTEQSGHIAAVGYEMYCTLLENAVRQLKHLPPRLAVEVNVDLPWPAYLPKDYVPGQKPRIEVYRRLSRVRELPTLEDFRQELRDRYGPLPEAVEWLFRATEIRLRCVQWDIAAVHRDGRDMVFRYRTRGKIDQLVRQSRSRMKVIDDKVAYLRVRPEEESPEALYQLLLRLLSDQPVAVGVAR